MSKGIRLRGARVLIIGGSAGAGLGVALEAAKRGAAEILLVARGQARLDAAKARITVPCRTLACDVDAEFSKIPAAMKDPDIVIYSAAAGGFECFDELSEAAFDLAMKSTAYGALRAARAFLPSMLQKKRGAFVIIGSPVFRIDFPAIAYKASRGALVGVYEALVEDLRKTQVNVCFAEPARISNSGYFDTNEGVTPRLPWNSRKAWTRASWQSDIQVGEMVCSAIEKGRRSAMPLSIRALITLLPRWLVTATMRWFSEPPASGGFPSRS
jgi:short-subunit dehydrogenase